MPAPTSTLDFLDVVRRSGLVPPARLTTLLARTAPTADGQIDPLADALVRGGLVTFFQVKQLKQGRYKRFQIAGKYRLLELLGVGGMGAVYLCEHEYMKRLVAVKVLPADKITADPTALDRFYREARAVAALDHPNVVRAYDIDKFDGVHFLVMEYVDGASLQEVVGRYVTRKEAFDPCRAAHYVSQAAAGLQHASELGLIHRDVKPGNLLLDRSGTIKVLDMGLARFFDHRHDGLTERLDDKCVLGTADYLAPEQASQETVDIRADIYGLGGTLYFLLTGSSPFPDGNVAQKLLAHQTQKPKPVSAFRTDVPEGLLRVLNVMMKKDPAERYQTPNEVIEALEPWTRTPLPPPPEAEMPALCPLVLQLMGQNPIPGHRSGSGYPALKPPSNGSSGANRVAPPDRSQATVPTQRGHDTTPIRLLHASGPLTPRPAADPLEPASRPRVAYRRRTLAAVAAGSSLLTGVLLALAYLFLLR